jgi:hypothetical protein
MAFYGYSFTYNGVSCDEYNLMLYDVGGEGQDNGQFITREPVEERLARNYQPLYYGSIFNKLLPRAKNESRKKQRAGKRSKRKEHTKERPKWPLFCAGGNRGLAGKCAAGFTRATGADGRSHCAPAK